MPISEQELLAYFERSGRRPVKIRDVARALDVPRKELRALRDLVHRLEEEGKLRRGSNRRYQSLSSPDLIDSTSHNAGFQWKRRMGRRSFVSSLSFSFVISACSSLGLFQSSLEVFFLRLRSMRRSL